MRRLLLVLTFVTGCGPEVTGGDDMPPGEECTGSETRCDGSSYQICDNGTYVTMEACSFACSPATGCAQCDPNAGNTCSGNDVVACNSDGTLGPSIMTCGVGTMCSAGTCSNACTADGVDLIYVVDEMNRFLSFDPRLLPNDPFKMIGTLNCPTTRGSIQIPQGAVTPFSMSVDRDGKAWVEYTSGEIFNVSLQDASCTASGYVPEAGGMALFGMGYVSDAPGSEMEKLYIVGGGRSAEPNGKLAYVDTHAMQYTPQQTGTITAGSDYSPELTGTGEGKLYGFYPRISGSASYIQEIDKASGAPVGAAWNMEPLGDQIRAWAFAQWGNKFYVFVTTQNSQGTLNSTVRTVDKMTGQYQIILQNLPYSIPGAGVSTCAPSVIGKSPR